MKCVLGVYFDNLIHTQDGNISAVPWSRDYKELLNKFGFFQLEEITTYGSSESTNVIKNFISIDEGDRLTNVLLESK